MDTKDLPLENGFRLRGAQVTRLEAFVDAAFAFALTLLVISVDSVPASIPELVEAMKGVPAFAASFAQIALFWHAHARWSKRYGLDDGPTVFLSLLLVFLALVYVYPLKLLFSSFFAWISGGWLPSSLQSISGYPDIRFMFIAYGVAFATLSLCLSALYSHALRQHAALGLDAGERAATAADTVVWRFAAMVAAVSVAIACLIPDRPPYWAAGLPGLAYFLMNLSWWVGQRATARELARVASGASS